METSDNSEVLPSKSDPLLPVSISNPNHEVGVSLNTINALPQSKSKILYESVASVNPLDEGVIHAADVEDAFRVAYVDFQRDFMEELKELFFNKFEKQLLQIQSDISSIKQQQTRQIISSNLIESLKKDNETLKQDYEKLQRSFKIDDVKKSFSSALSETIKQVPNFESKRQLFSPCTTTPILTDTTESSKFPSADDQNSNNFKQESENHCTPVPVKWADICNSHQDSPITQGWAIAAASVSSKSPHSPLFSKKKESLNIVLSGDIPSGSVATVKEELVKRFNAAINPSFRGLERDFVCSDITNILFHNNSIHVRLCSSEVKHMIFENRKLLSGSLRCPSGETASLNNPFPSWKMFVSPHLDAQDLKNQKIVLNAFLSRQLKENGSPSFKAYAQGFSIKIVTAEGAKFFYPFDCKQSPNQFLASKGIKSKY